MGDLLEYSGLATKIKAMKSKLLREDDYINLAESGSIADVISYLKKIETYDEVFGEQTENVSIQRFEKLVRNSLYVDYDKIYRFSGEKQKKYLRTYFMKYEVDFLRKHIRRCLAVHTNIDTESVDSTLFDKKSCLDENGIRAAQSMNELIAALVNTPYYAPLKMVSVKSDASLFDYETILDILYFRTIWKTADKVLSASDRKILRKTFGEKIDLLNLVWIYRAKKYYKLSQIQMYSMVIPEYYRIKKQDMIWLIKCETLEEFDEGLKKLSYLRHDLEPENINPETMYEERMEKLYLNTVKKEPYSIACIDSYFYMKECEIKNLIRLGECILYQESTDTIMKCIKI